jgi:monofunctional biosynthetic peptidoglycan transglycosylase
MSSAGSRPNSHLDVWQRLRSNILPCLRTAIVAGTGAILVVGVGLVVAVTFALAVFRTTTPPGSMVMWAEYLDGQSIDQRWVGFDRIPPSLVRAVVMSEDNQFCRHYGVDLREFATVLRRFRDGTDEDARGGSTISMQVAKNLFLWKDRSYLRKALELPITLQMELMWPKRRIMEVYLNIAEFAPGVYGAEAAARHHFRKPAHRLTDREAALLAASLPNPAIRIASRPSPALRRVASVIERRARAFGNRASCVLGRR